MPSWSNLIIWRQFASPSNIPKIQVSRMVVLHHVESGSRRPKLKSGQQWRRLGKVNEIFTVWPSVCTHKNSGLHQFKTFTTVYNFLGVFGGSLSMYVCMYVCILYVYIEYNYIIYIYIHVPKKSNVIVWYENMIFPGFYSTNDIKKKNVIFPGFPRFDLFVAVVELWGNGLAKGKNMILYFLFHKQTCASIWVII